MYNPPNSTPLVLLRRSMESSLDEICDVDGSSCDTDQAFHTKDLYTLTDDSRKLLEGTNEAMCEMLVPEARGMGPRQPHTGGSAHSYSGVPER